MDRRPSSRTRAPGPALSLEASLDEENREVLAALDHKRARSPLSSSTRNATPPPPIRSMLDIGSPTPRHGSIAGIGVGITSPSSTRRSKLDPSDPSTYTSPHASKPNSPTMTRISPVSTRPRDSSDSDRPQHVGLPKIDYDGKRDFEQDYQFDISSIPSSAGAVGRNPNDNKRPREGSGGAMAAALTGDFSSLQLSKSGGQQGRHNSSTATGTHSQSPSSRLRSPDSTKSSLKSPASPSIKVSAPPGNGTEMNSHRRLSNKSSSFSTNTDESEEGVGQVRRDGIGEEDVIEEYSDEDNHSLSSDEEDRGRDRSERKPDTENPEQSSANNTEGDNTLQTSPSESQRKQVPHSQIIKSLLEPSISVTSPMGKPLTSQVRTGINPSSNFNPPGPPSSAGSMDDDDDGEAIRKAKSLPLNISPLDSSVPDRHVRILLRGNWAQFHEDAEKELRTARTYLCCTDLSLEASYALEWVVGTILRDGDTLLAINAIEDENAGKATEADRDILQAEGVKAAKDATEAMNTLTRQTTLNGTVITPNSLNKYIPATEAQSLTGSVDARKVSKKEMERLRAIEEITQNFLKLVRKTTLQVRCMVEVIHCKSPKHLILGAIDELSPTLAIVGTRGRSSLKGVLLGSFSNYLVTKSSVPVMVARRKLKKPRGQARVSSNKIRLTNNLTASNVPVKRRSLTQARID